jgi:hypothetical protein
MVEVARIASSEVRTMTIGNTLPGTIARRIGATVGVGVMAAALLAVPQATLARNGGGSAVTRAGTCTVSSTAKIKAKPDDGMLEVEFEVDSNHNGQTWHVVLKKNDVKFFSGNRVTHAPSGSFEVNKRTGNPAGSDTIRGRATNLGNGEVCRAHVTL